MITNRSIAILAVSFFGFCTLMGLAGGLNAFPLYPEPQATSPTPTREQDSVQDKKETEAQEKIKQLQKELDDQKKRLEVVSHEAAAAKAEVATLAYLNRLALAQQKWQANEIFRADQILDECTPALRGWEWNYLKRLNQGGLLKLPGHSCVAYSPDGKHLASAAGATLVKLWNPTSGQEVLSLNHAGVVLGVAFSPDGKRLASCGSDKTVRVWDLSTAKEIVTLKGHKDWVSRVAFSPDGRRLASASGLDRDLKSAEVKVWDATTGKELLTFTAHTRQVLALAFSPDGKRIATGGSDDAPGEDHVKLWDSVTGKLLLTLKAEHQFVFCVAFSPDGKLLASAGHFDETVKVWDLGRGKEALILRGHTQPVTAVAFSPDGKHLVSAAGDGTGRLAGEIKVWDAKTGQEVLKIREPMGAITSITYSPDGQRIASAGAAYVNIWDASSPQEAITFKKDLRKTSDLKFSPNGKWLAAAVFAADLGGKAEKGLRIWDVKTGEEVDLVNDKTYWVHCVAFSPNSRRLAFGNAEEIEVWDTSSRKRVFRLKGKFLNEVYCLAFSPDGKLLASGTGRHFKLPKEPEAIKIWDAATGEEKLILVGHTGSVNSVAFSPDGKVIASGSEDDTIRIWDAISGKELLTLRDNNGVNALAFSPDGTRVASANGRFAFRPGEVKIWNIKDGKELVNCKGHSEHVTSVVFSPDGKRLASGSWDKTVKLWDAATGQEILTLQGTTDVVARLAFSPDSHYLAAATGWAADGDSVIFWDGTPIKEKPKGEAQPRAKPSSEN